MGRATILLHGLGAILIGALSSVGAQAQVFLTGSEITGQRVDISVNGSTNAVYFDQGGSARIIAVDGSQVNGTWFVRDGSICLAAAGAEECWAYRSQFQAGQAVVLTSNCGTQATWVPLATTLPPKPVQIQQAGERG